MKGVNKRIIEMEKVEIYDRVLIQTKEILKYFEKDLLDKIPKELIEKLNSVDSTEYQFDFDKNKRLNDPRILKETKEFISAIFMQYCCNEEEREKLNKICIENDKKKTKHFDAETLLKEEEKIESNNLPITVEEKVPLYKRIIIKIKRLFKMGE